MVLLYKQICIVSILRLYLCLLHTLLSGFFLFWGSRGNLPFLDFFPAVKPKIFIPICISRQILIWVIVALSPSVTSTQSVCCDCMSLRKNSQTSQPGKRRFRTDGFSFSITMSLMHTCCHPSHIFLHRLNSHQTETYCTIHIIQLQLIHIFFYCFYMDPVP